MDGRDTTTRGGHDRALTPKPPAKPSDPTAQPGELRRDAVARWVREGRDWQSMVRAGQSIFEVGATTIKRDIRRARSAAERLDDEADRGATGP